MNSNYILISKLKEIAQNKRMVFIIVICLVLGYTFILIFSSKLYEINRRMSLGILKHVENAYHSSDFDEFKIFKDPEVEAGIEHRTDYKSAVVYFTFKNETHMTNAIEADKGLQHHYKFEDFSDAVFNGERSEGLIMVSENLANEFHMNVGDVLIVNGSSWTIDSIVASEYFRRTIIFPENADIGKNNGYYSNGSIIQFNEAFLKSHSDVLEILEDSKFTPLQQRQRYTLKSLSSYALFLVGFALLFISLSILNCYLVFFANISYKRKMFGIKKTYGASSSTCFGDIFLENTLFSLLAFHIACLLVHTFRFNVPVFFYTEVSLPVYGVGIAVVFIITVLYSLLIFRKINKLSTIKLLKE